MSDRPQNKHLIPPKPGEVRNPNGRPKGSRNKLGEAFVADLYADWVAHGNEVIAAVRAERPADYLKVTASILPKQLEVKTDAFDGVSDEELAALVTLVRAAVDTAEKSGSGTEAQDGPQQAGDIPPLH